jgi:hypothetical protein
VSAWYVDRVRTAFLGVIAIGLLSCRRAPNTVDAVEAGSAPSSPTSSAASASPSSPTLDASIATSTPSAAPSASHLPAVNVTWIGMHIGGGPNDDAHKNPIAKDVEAHFDELRACYAHVARRASGVLGVDLLIPSSGGVAQVSRPRTTLEGEAFLACAVSVLASVSFSPPKTGLTTGVSYSVRFDPR